MLTHRHTSHRTPRRGERGIALIFAIFTMAALLIAIAGALVTGSANSRASTNYTSASRAHFAAEAGISDALQRINIAGGAGNGVLNYQTEVVNNWSNGTLWPAGYFPKTYSTAWPMNQYNYSVTTTAGGVPSQSGRLVSTAVGPDGVRNVVVANIVRANQPSTAPGAIYLATDDSTDATFQGNTFFVDGNDYNYTGGAGPGPSVPGISTRNSSNTNEAIASLNPAQQPDNVQGYGYSAGPPIVPSISTVPWGPTIAQLQYLETQLTTGQTACTTNKMNNSCSCGCVTNGTKCDCGSTGTPALTWVQPDGGKLTIMNNGNVDGAGIMIIDGDLDIQGTVGFKGLILVRGKLTVSGNALIYGTIWAQGYDLNVAGTGQVYYSTQALALANTVFPNGALPSPMRIVSLADCSDLAPGTPNSGCP